MGRKSREQIEKERQMVEDSSVGTEDLITSSPDTSTNLDVNLSNEERVSRETLERQRNYLINTLKPLLLNKRRILEGGHGVRNRFQQETQNYIPMMKEINELGLKLGYSEITLNHLRRD